ncbi:thioredoxin [Paenibacillus macerans]|uniref:thioredoxin n=1 Tax=Paenibacillus macerans TaxID=44252 RepID=UPI002DB763EE|nr:thioredoxin [Paenibacillus macerans]MEC0139645.1 thioredoxin [Paenibacillus macerans]
MTIRRIADANEFNRESAASELVLADFDAPWCPPCKVLSPILEELHEEFQGAVPLLQVNCDDHPELASQYGIMSMPTVIFFRGGEPVEKLIGLRPKDAYRELIRKYRGYAGQVQ